MKPRPGSQRGTRERWESQAAVKAFRGDGVGEDQGSAILGASVTEHDVAATRVLTSS